MLKALYTSANSLINGINAIDIVSNNIANLNTVGYKKQRLEFSDLLYNTIRNAQPSQDPEQVGSGNRLSSIDTLFNQGAIQHTNKPTDVAIEGDGFFVLYNGRGSDLNSQTLEFTRAGDFSFDGDLNLVSPNGYKVVGWLGKLNQNGNGYYIPTDPTTGLPTGDLTPINISNYGNVPAVASTYIRFKANLNSGSTVEEYTLATSDRDFKALLDSNGESLNVKNGDNFEISFNGGSTWTVFQYHTSGVLPPGVMPFTTVSSLIGDMNSVIASEGIDANATFNHGLIQINNTSATNTLNILVRSTDQDPLFSSIAQDNPKLTTVMSALNQNVSPGKNATSEPLEVPTHIVRATFYDSTGEKHKLDVTFTKKEQNIWDYTVTLPDKDGTVSGGTGQVIFDDNGGLDPSVSSPSVTVSLTNGASPVSLLINFWNTDDGKYDGNQFTGLTQFSMPSETTYETADGSPSGILKKVDIDYLGNVNASYSNGKTYTIAKLAIARFTNPGGLKRDGDTMFSITQNVDKQSVINSLGYIGVANCEGRGTIVPSGLEASNVDLAEALTNMIMYQESFSANSEGFRTANQIIQTAIQLNR